MGVASVGARHPLLAPVALDQPERMAVARSSRRVDTRSMTLGAPSALELLLLCDAEPGVENTIRDHIVALQRQSRHSIHPLSFRKRLPATLDFRRFDGVVLHYSVLARSPDYLDDRARQALREFGGLKAAFLQD